MSKVKDKSWLIDEVSEEVAYGISTGGDKIFRVEKEFAVSNKFETEILKPVIVGGDIDRFSSIASNHYIIYSTKKININKFPNIYNYLKPYKLKLSQKRETRKGMLPWWCLHWPRYEDLFIGEKIILRQTADRLRATIDLDNYFTLDSIMIIKLNNKIDIDYKFVLAALNSKLNKLFYKNISQEEGRVFAQVKPKNIRNLFIPKIDFQNHTEKFSHDKIVNSIDQMLEARKQLQTVTTDKDKTYYERRCETLDRQIDQLVYELYRLTEEEIKIVEGEG